MREKKHIDRIFQESFKDFEAIPSDSVWNTIEERLEKKNRKRRIIPLWWRYTGVAALLLLFLSLGGLYLQNNQTTPNIQVVDTESQELNNLQNLNKSSTSVVNNEVIDNASSNSNTNSENTLFQQKQEVQHGFTSSNGQTIITSPNSKVNQRNQLLSNQQEHSNKVVASSNISDKHQKIASTETNKKEQNAQLESPIIDKEDFNNLASKQNSVALSTVQEKNANNLRKTNINENTLTIEEAIDKNKDITPSNIPENRWSVAPNIAPVYFNTLSQGSTIDGQFNNNAKTGDVNMSYGIATSYAINKKLKIRSGINKVNLGYNTNDIIVYQSNGVGSSALRNVNESSTSLAVASDQSIESNSSLNTVISTNSSINQSFGYIEVPLEVQYTFVDKRVGINVIGGFSSFFLESNEIYSEIDNGTRSYLGEANNINDISYSANVGLGLNYRFSKKIDLNLEPTFKYQFNTFSNTSGNFTPFFIGVYTGFAIKF
ncbi:PorT family protein [Cognatitamlana onchidii]|uniref:PorT family protein n=1 Tax=Cognatitamlana onchidii TaxID=2562860 RepID=UPI0010A664C4|nr:PorT family protein [Algibacter onchidii]